MQDFETGLLVILINNPNLIENLQIKPKYLENKDNAILLNAFIKMYQKNKYISHENLSEYVKQEDLGRIINLYASIYVDELYINTNIQQKFEFLQRKILDTYKQKYIKQVNQKYIEDKINYNELKENINKVDEIQITTNSQILTSEEIKNNIKLCNVGIDIDNFPKLNDKLKLLQNDLLVVGATTGVGKSGFLLNLMNNLMYKYQCIYFNIEMSKATIYRRLIAINKNIPVNCIDNPTSYQQELIDKAIQEISDNQIIIEHQKSDISEIRNVVSKMKNKDKHTIVFIDHIGLLKCSEYKKSLYEQSTEIVKCLRNLCLEYDCTMICASQLNRTAYNTDKIELNMLKDSGEIENSSRKAILLYKDKNSNNDDLEPNMNVYIAKNDTGMTGIIKMKYFKTKQIFKEILEQ